jgi:hypothetical protein
LRPTDRNNILFYFISTIINIPQKLNLFTKCVKQEKAKSRNAFKSICQVSAHITAGLSAPVVMALHVNMGGKVTYSQFYFTYGLFNKGVSSLGYTSSNDRMISE